MPISKSVPIEDLARKTILLWGSPKIGKSTLAAGFPDAVFLATEAGLNDLAATRWEGDDGKYVITTWAQLLTATAEVVQSGAKTIVLDTADNAYYMCERFICEKHGAEYKTDKELAYGKGTALINGEFRRYILKLSSLGVGLILISHATTETRDTRTGTVEMNVPTLPEKIRPIIEGMADMILYYTTKTRNTEQGRTIEHVIYSKPDPTFIAGDRSGRLPDCLVMPKANQYAHFAAAYYGQTINTPAAAGTK